MLKGQKLLQFMRAWLNYGLFLVWFQSMSQSQHLMVKPQKFDCERIEFVKSQLRKLRLDFCKR